MFWTRRNGHLTDDDLSAYLDGELANVRRNAVAQHLAACPDCAAALDGMRDVKALLSRLPEVEPPRSFVLTPAMAGMEQKRPQAAPRRQSLVFVPAVALTLLVALFAVDLASSGSTSSRNEAGTSQAIAAQDASSNADAAKSSGGAGSGSERSTFSAPVAPSAPSPQNPAAIPPPATGDPSQPPPVAAAPRTGQGISPPTTPGTDLTPSAAAAPAPPVTGPLNQTAPSTGTSSNGEALTPVVVAPSVPSTGLGAVPVPPAPSTGGGVTSSAQPESANSATGNPADVFGDDGTSSRQSSDSGGSGADWLRIAEIAAAVAFIASFAYVFGPGLIKKGH